MTKRLVILILILASVLSPAWSASTSHASTDYATIGYVYGNAVASVDFKELPSVGTLVIDEENNILIVRDSSEKAVIFDKISTRSSIKVGNRLASLGYQHIIFLRASLNHVSLGYSLSTVLYPLKPLALVGISYPTITSNALAYDGAYFTLGFESDVVLSRLWDTSFTLLEDGGIMGWCTAGVFVKDKVSFVICYGLSYRHFIGNFRWELGLSWVKGSNSIRYYSPFVGVGVSL